MAAADEKVVGWDAIGHLVAAVEASVATHGKLLCKEAKPPVGEQMQEVLVATMRGRDALANVDPPAVIQVLKALVNALEPRLIGDHALVALKKAAQETAGEMTISAAGTIHAVITQQLAAEPAGLLRRLLQLLAAAVDAGQPMRDLAFVWGPLLGVPSESVTAMEALLTSERKLPATHPTRSAMPGISANGGASTPATPAAPTQEKATPGSVNGGPRGDGTLARVAAAAAGGRAALKPTANGHASSSSSPAASSGGAAAQFDKPKSASALKSNGAGKPQKRQLSFARKLASSPASAEDAPAAAPAPAPAPANGISSPRQAPRARPLSSAAVDGAGVGGDAGAGVGLETAARPAAPAPPPPASAAAPTTSAGPLPPDWEEKIDPVGPTYYFNRVTGESSSTRPPLLSTAHAPAAAPAPAPAPAAASALRKTSGMVVSVSNTLEGSGWLNGRERESASDDEYEYETEDEDEAAGQPPPPPPPPPQQQVATRGGAGSYGDDAAYYDEGGAEMCEDEAEEDGRIVVSLGMQVAVRRQPGEGIGLGIALDADGTAIISQIAPGSPAEACGLQLLDRVVSVDGHAVPIDVEIGDLFAAEATVIRLGIARRLDVDSAPGEDVAAAAAHAIRQAAGLAGSDEAASGSGLFDRSPTRFGAGRVGSGVGGWGGGRGDGGGVGGGDQAATIARLRRQLEDAQHELDARPWLRVKVDLDAEADAATAAARYAPTGDATADATIAALRRRCEEAEATARRLGAQKMSNGGGGGGGDDATTEARLVPMGDALQQKDEQIAQLNAAVDGLQRRLSLGTTYPTSPTAPTIRANRANGINGGAYTSNYTALSPPRTVTLPPAPFEWWQQTQTRSATPTAAASAAEAVKKAAGGGRPPFASPVACGHAVHALASMAAPRGGGGGLVLAAGRDGALRGYGAGGVEEVCVPNAHADRIWALVALPAASATQPPLVASASADCTVRLWRGSPAAGGGGGGGGGSVRLERFETLRGHQAAVHCLLPHRGMLASGGDDCTVRLWDVGARAQRGTCVLPPTTPSEEHTAAYALAESAAGLWCGHWGGTVNLWDSATCSLLQTMRGAHQGAVWAMQQLPSGIGADVATAGADGAVRLWDSRQQRAAAELPPVGCALYALAWHGGGSGVLLFGGYDGALRGWDPRMASGARFVVSAHSTPVRCLLTTADGTLWSGATDGTVAQWSIDELLSSGAPQQQLDA